MIKLIGTLIATFAIILAFGQEEISNTKTAKHQQIAGTKFFLIPPTGFTSATNFQGFQQPSSGASILVMEIPGPFSETSKGFDEQALKTQGMLLKHKEEVQIGGMPGLFLTSEQSAHGTNYTKYTLVFGNAKATYMLNGTFPREKSEMEPEVRASLLSVVYDPDVSIDPLSAVPFSIETENTKLKFGTSVSGMLLYTVDGKVPTESSDKTTFIVGLSLANIQTIDKKQTAITRIKRMPYTDLKLDENSIHEIEIDGIPGYEIVGEGLDKNGTRDLIYQVMLFTESGYYIMLGTTEHDFQPNLELFKNVARTFRQKS